jgi:hypothetical protein
MHRCCLESQPFPSRRWARPAYRYVLGWLHKAFYNFTDRSEESGPCAHLHRNWCDHRKTRCIKSDMPGISNADMRSSGSPVRRSAMEKQDVKKVYDRQTPQCNGGPWHCGMAVCQPRALPSFRSHCPHTALQFAGTFAGSLWLAFGGGLPLRRERIAYPFRHHKRNNSGSTTAWLICCMNKPSVVRIQDDGKSRGKATETAGT